MDLFFTSLGVAFTRRKQRFFKLRLTHIPTLNTGKLTFVSRKAILCDLHFGFVILLQFIKIKKQRSCSLGQSEAKSF